MAEVIHKSAGELQTLRRKQTRADLPCRTGPKDSFPDGSEEQTERLEQQLQQFEEVLTEERVSRRGNLSVGKWNSEKKIAEIEIEKGVHWQVFGKTVDGKLVLQPEEALYMVDHGMLELYYNHLPMSIQQTYEMLLSDSFPLYYYLVYSYLRNFGFIVLRHQSKPNPDAEELRVEKMEEIGEDIEELVNTNEGKTTPEALAVEENPVSHYWKDEQCRPLVHPSDSTSLENILSKLQIIKSQTAMEALQLEEGATRLEITFDVFQPQKKFKKSNPGLPNHCICICKFSDTPPSIGEMNSLARESHPVPLKYAVVDGRDISFYSMLDVQLPTYAES